MCWIHKLIEQIIVTIEMTRMWSITPLYTMYHYYNNDYNRISNNVIRCVKYVTINYSFKISVNYYYSVYMYNPYNIQFIYIYVYIYIIGYTINACELNY